MLTGAALAVILAAGARLLKFDIDRSYYAAVLIVIASYYVLFGFIAAERWQTIGIEIALACGFAALAIMGALRWPLLIGTGLLLHGVFDLFHSQLVNNSGTPDWWPAFCVGVDIVLGFWVLLLSKRRMGLLTLGGKP